MSLEPHDTLSKISCSGWNCILLTQNEMFFFRQSLESWTNGRCSFFLPSHLTSIPSILPLSSERESVKIKTQKWLSSGWFLLLEKKPVNRHGRNYMQQLQKITIFLLMQSSIFQTWRYISLISCLKHVWFASPLFL